MKFFTKDSMVEGLGLFANRNIRKGEHIFTFRGKICNEKNTKKLNEHYLMTVDWNKVMYVSKPMRYINHSCNPNTGLKGLKVIALKNIKSGKELTIDYDTLEYEWKMKCHCGSKDCRKIIKGWKYLPERLQNKYKRLGAVNDYLLGGNKK